MKATKSTEMQHDDLTMIKGIGQATDRWLKESFKVQTFRDLAALSTSRLEAGLKDIGRTTSRKKIDEWLTQARQFAGAPTRAPKPGVRSAGARSGGKPDSPPEEDEWKPFASFVVEFQVCKGKNGAEKQRTAVHHLEADKNEGWAGIEDERLCRWMLERIGEERPQRPEEQPSVEALPSEATGEQPPAQVQPAGQPPVTVEVTQIRAFQPPETTTPQVMAPSGGTSVGLVRGGEPVSFELSFQLSGPGATELAKSHARINAVVYAYNRSTGVKKHLCGSTGMKKHLSDNEPKSAQEDKLSRTTILPQAVLERGTYRLDCLATLAVTPPRQGYLKVPILRVV